MPVIPELYVTIKAFQVKTIGSGDNAEDVVEIKIHAPLGKFDLGDLSRIRKGSPKMTLECSDDQMTLPLNGSSTAVSKELEGQMKIPAGSPPVFSVRLVSMPLTMDEIKKAENYLKKLTGIKSVDELRKDVLHNLPDGPVLIAERVNEIDAAEIRIALNALGAAVDLIEWPKEETEEDDPSRPFQQATDDYLNAKLTALPLPPNLWTNEQSAEHEEIVAEKQRRDPNWVDPAADDIAFQERLIAQGLAEEAPEQPEEEIPEFDDPLAQDSDSDEEPEEIQDVAA